MDNKELEKLFREELEDHRETPDPKVWNRIRSSLDKKKRTRVLPLWWRWGAAAAVLAGMLFLINPWENSEMQTPSVTESGVKQKTIDPEKKDAPDLNKSQVLPGQPDALAGQEDGETQSGKVFEETGNIVGADSSPNEPTSGNANPSPEPTSIASENSDARKTRYGEQEKELIPIQPDKASELAISETASEKTASENNTIFQQVDLEKAQETAAVETQEAEKKSIFEAIEEQDALAEEPEKGGKWLVGPSVAPVYFDSFGNGSPISPNFVNNTKSGALNMSYGLQVAYKVSKRISIRSGIHRVDYGYNTEEIGFTSSPAARPSSLIRTISYSENSRSLVVHSTASGAQEPQQPTAVDISAPSPARQGQMVQEFGYLEVPVEMQYTLIDKKWGLNLIGGMSSLFLMDNSVSLESSGTITEIGESNNMNSLNFSTNLGLGLFYRLNPRLELNLLPMFKYQLNTFSQTEGSFRPYSVGVYSGLSFRF